MSFTASATLASMSLQVVKFGLQPLATMEMTSTPLLLGLHFHEMNGYRQWRGSSDSYFLPYKVCHRLGSNPVQGQIGCLAHWNCPLLFLLWTTMFSVVTDSLYTVYIQEAPCPWNRFPASWIQNLLSLATKNWEPNTDSLGGISVKVCQSFWSKILLFSKSILLLL